MPKLGEFIGALLSDVVQARVRADLEAVRVAEAYSGHELLKHLPVPRFRLPDITVDVPVLVTAVGGVSAEAGGRSFGQPTSAEITKAVRAGLSGSGIRLPRPESTKVVAAAIERATVLFETGPQLLLSPRKVSGELAASVVSAVRDTPTRDIADERLMALETATRESLGALLASKLVESPSLQVMVTAGEIKAHADSDSLVRVRLTISEDAYEVVPRDDGPGYYLTPE